MSSIEALPQSVSIEFPMNVKSHEKAIEAVGGPQAIANAVNNPETRLELRLRKDPFHHPINSFKSETSNVVLEIRVPTWALEQANGDIQKALELAKGGYSARPVLFSASNFKFREMADFQYYTGQNPLANRLKTSVMSGDLENIMKYKISRETPTELLPGPRFSQQTQPLFYNYKQPSSVALIKNSDGELRLVNKTKSATLKSHVIHWDDPVPTGPREDLDPAPRESIQECINDLKAIFEKRPSYSRRAITALLSEESRRAVRYALPYVAYFYKSGPWRALYVRYGVNPKEDKSMAPYQVEHFRFANTDDSARPEDTISTFDGEKAPTTRMLQLCDVSEPFLKDYIAQCVLKDTPTEADGWFDCGDMAAIRRVLRTQLEIVRDKRERLSPAKLNEIAVEAKLKGESASANPETLEEEEEEGEEEEGEEDDSATTKEAETS